MTDLQWLEALHREYYKTLCTLAANRLRLTLGDASEAEDVVQEAFLLAAAKDIRHHEAPAGWLIKTVINLCRRRVDVAIRAERSSRRAALDLAPAAVSLPGSHDAADTLAEMEAQLSASDWELVRLHFLEGLPADEVAQRLHTSVPALRVRLHRLRKKMKKSSLNL